MPLNPSCNQLATATDPAEMSPSPDTGARKSGTSYNTLRRVHELRWKAHWGDKYDVAQQPWPKTEADWRQTAHGAPWDANVHMAQWHLELARKMQAEGLL